MEDNAQPPILPTTTATMKRSGEKKSPRFLSSSPFSFFQRSPQLKNRSSSDSSASSKIGYREMKGQPDPEVPTLLHSAPPMDKQGRSKSFPRSMTIASSSESSTLVNSVSPGFLTYQMEGNENPIAMNKGDSDASSIESPLPTSVQIAGITVLLSESTSRASSLKLFVNGKEFVKLPFNYDHTRDSTAPLRWSLQPYLTIRPESNLIIQVRRRRIWPKSPVIAEAKVNFDDAAQVIKSSSFPDDTTVHQLILREDPLVVLDLVSDADPLQANMDIAADKAREIRSILDHLGKSRRFLEALLAYGSAISELDPIAKAVLGCVRVAYKQLLDRDKCDRIIVNLAADMARTLGYIGDVEQFARIFQLKKALEDVRPLMEDTANFIIKYVNRTKTEKLLNTHDFREDIDRLKKRFDIFQQQFDRGIAVQSAGSVEKILQRLTSTEDDQILKGLKPKGLELGSRPVAECMKGTRTDVLSFIDEWIDDLEAPNILWVRGFPGVGKSSIASTVISNLRQRNRLGSRFIFEREKVTLSTPNSLWRSVAYDLSRLYPSVRNAVVERLKDEDVDVETSNVKALFRELIEEPLSDCGFIPLGRLPVIVVDALDECGGRDGRRSAHREGLLQTLKRWHNLPLKFKLIVTSRIEDDISRVLGPICESVDLSTGNKVKEQASLDIELFLKVRFAKIAKQYPESLGKDWPGSDVRTRLTKRAAGLFLWAKTAIGFVNLGEPIEQLKLLDQDSGAGLGDVALLYAKVLEVSFRTPSGDVLQAFQGIVGAVVFAKRPLTREECLRLLPYPPSMLDFVRMGLRSVLDSTSLEESGSDMLRFSHQSFVEFLLNSDKCPDAFRIEEVKQHRNLAGVSLKIMVEELRFNIAQFPTSHAKNAAMVDLDYRAETLVTTPLIYACRFWMDHVHVLPWDEELFELIKVVILDKLLFWLEVLSLIGDIYSASYVLKTLLEWCKDKTDLYFLEFVEDALKFLDAFSGVMSQSLPHIYISAIPFAPKNSKVAQRFRHQFPRSVRMERSKFAEWPRVVFTVDEHEGVINSAAFSPDGRFIVSGSNDKTVRVWDAETGDLISGPMELHDNAVGTVAFSRDGRYIASGSDDSTIGVWDTESGDLIAGPLEGHGSVVTAVAFSGDGLHLASASYDGTIRIWDMSPGCVGRFQFTIEGHVGAVTTIAFSPDDAKIVSGSVDRDVCVWDAMSGELLYGPFKGHRNRVNSVVFLPEGKRVASASEDETIYIWDLEIGNIILGPLEGHTDAVTSIAFSPDGNRLVSGSHDGILILWDAETGDVVCEPFTGHKSGVTSVAFSPDGRRILSSSCDGTLAVWDAESAVESYSLTPFLDIPAHQDNVKSIALSPDGLRIVSGSDDETIRLWDAESGEPVNDVRFHCHDLDGHHWHRFPLPPSHRQGVDVVAYSPDGALIASAGGNRDGDVFIWDSTSGELLQPILRGHSGGITSIVFLPDSLHLVSSSFDRTIRIWDIKSGETTLGPLAPHDGWVTSIAVSPDGALIASASNDRTIRIFDSSTGEQIGGPLVGHSNAINCIVFTIDSKRIVSGSHDKTIRLWDIENGNGECVWTLDEAHLNVILCLAVTPSGRYVASGSVDSTIKIWDLETGELALGPLEGHTGTVFSIAFNKEGTRLVSSSEDETIRVWDVSSIDIRGCFVGARPAEFADDSGYQNGWIVKSKKEESECLLLWVPPWCRSGVWWPRNTAVVSETAVKLDLRTFVHGERWHECYDPDAEMSPITTPVREAGRSVSSFFLS